MVSTRSVQTESIEWELATPKMAFEPSLMFDIVFNFQAVDLTADRGKVGWRLRRAHVL